jgi:L-asparaginase
MQAFHKKLLVLGMGGTIAGRSQAQGDNVGYRAGELPVESLLPRGVNDVECLANVQIETRQIAQMDSKDMDHATWFVLARAVLAACADEAVAGIVITHGTDTLEETAFFLSQLCAPSKPVVLTCAMRPATALSPDGPQNMVDALCVAANPSADGVWVVAAGAVHRPTQVAKVHPYRTDAFSSGETGPVGVVEEGRLRWLHSAGGKFLCAVTERSGIPTI